MRNLKRLTFILAMISLPVFFFAACEKDDNGNKGTLRLALTDSPIDADDVTGVFITFTEIQYKIQGDQWASFDEFDEPVTYNLLDLTRGETALFGHFELPAGTYTQLRFMLDAPTMGGGSDHANPGCYIEFEDETIQPLFVPSGAQTGFKAVGTFTVPANGEVAVTADFDVRKSIVVAGASGKYILKPTIRLVVDDQAGNIQGEVTNIPEDTDIIIYAYESGTYTDEEADDPAEEETRFPNAIVSDKVCEENIYHLAFLAPISYDLIVTAYQEDEFIEVLGIIEEVEVESNTTTTVNIDLDEL